MGENLKTPDLQKTTTVVEDFLDNTGKKLAADFLQVPEAKLERSFLVLYCARQSRERSTGLGKVTIFLALGRLSPRTGCRSSGTIRAKIWGVVMRFWLHMMCSKCLIRLAEVDLLSCQIGLLNVPKKG